MGNNAKWKLRAAYSHLRWEENRFPSLFSKNAAASRFFFSFVFLALLLHLVTETSTASHYQLAGAVLPPAVGEDS